MKSISRPDFHWWQEEAIDISSVVDVTILHWPRQAGKTTIGTYLLKEYALANPGTLCFGCFIGAFLAMYDSKLLNELFSTNIAEKGKQYIKLTNGSIIKLVSANQANFRSYDVNFLFLDEYLFMQKNFLAAILPALNPDSKIIAVGTLADGAPSRGVTFGTDTITSILTVEDLKIKL